MSQNITGMYSVWDSVGVLHVPRLTLAHFGKYINPFNTDGPFGDQLGKVLL